MIPCARLIGGAVRTLVLVMLLGCGSSGLKSGTTLTTGVTTVSTTTTGTTTTGTTTSTAVNELTAEIGSYDWVSEIGETVTVEGAVASSNASDVSISWESDVDGVLVSDQVTPGTVPSLVTDTLSPGWHNISLSAEQNGQFAMDEVDVGICTWPPFQPFDNAGSLLGWTTFGDATWDPGGWIEITGIGSSRAGQLFNTDRKVNPGNVSIEFSIATGGGINGGADGFAVSVIAAYDVAELTTILNSASNGGCLGYGTSGACGSLAIDAFHVEFDTWNNPELGDATFENHIAIAINGDPNPLFTASVPSLEDLAWRDIRVDIVGSDITVTMDGSVVIQGTIPGFVFDGGYIGVSGSTGWASNYHRFDNLQLYDLCEVPGSTTTP